MGSFRSDTPKEIASFKVLEKVDLLTYKEKEFFDNKIESKMGLSKSDVIILKLENNIRIILRPSGTESKIKIYLSLCGKKMINLKRNLLKIKNEIKKIVNRQP